MVSRLNALQIFIGILLALLVVEGLLQLTDRNSYDQFFNDSETGLLLYTPNTSYTNSSSCYENEVKINNLGFYGPDFDENKSENTFRIVVVGSSFVEALQVPIEEQFTHLLEQKLNEEIEGDVVFEVLPFGFSGNGTYLNLLYYTNYAQRFQPDLVVNVITDFDLLKNKNDVKHPPRFDEDGSVILELEKKETGGTTVLAKNVLRKSKLFMSFYGRYLMIKAKSNNTEEPEEADVLNEQEMVDMNGVWGTEEKLLTYFNQLVKEQSARFLVVSWDDDERIENSDEHIGEHVQAIAERSDFSYFDLRPSVSQRRQDEDVTPTWSCDGHWNAVGHQWVSDALATHLIEQKNLLTSTEIAK